MGLFKGRIEETCMISFWIIIIIIRNVREKEI